MKIAALVSGGVDSSVALTEALRTTHEQVKAFYLKVWLEDELETIGSCPWEEDLAYVRAVCRQMGIDLEVVPLQLEYYERVVSYALSELRAGRTPSPDIFCNERIKFGAFYDYLSDDYDRIVTGHYARVEAGPTGGYVLKRGLDPVKDQTYFLSHLDQAQLSRAWFPIGGMHKSAVRARARELDLPNKDRRDSQGICFLGKIRYPEFIRHYLGERPGNIVERETGAVLGSHRGYWFYTIGQRQGLGLGGGPWYVVGKDTEENVVYVSHKNRVSENRRSVFTLGDLHWINGPPERTRLSVRIRHGPEVVPCTISEASGNPQGELAVEMDRADTGIAPGQFGVLYDDEVCLGAGMITD